LLFFTINILECLKHDITLHNSQGEFYEEFISGEIENFDPSTINEIALIQSNVPLCQREVKSICVSFSGVAGCLCLSVSSPGVNSSKNSPWSWDVLDVLLRAIRSVDCD
jgi:hypothetical protein